jgi:hypothetical protein
MGQKIETIRILHIFYYLRNMLLLGFDIGSSSVKAALVDTDTGQTLGVTRYPETEMPISSPFPIMRNRIRATGGGLFAKPHGNCSRKQAHTRMISVV